MPKATSRSAARLCCPSSSERLRKLARPKAIASSSGPVFVGKTRAGDKTRGNMRQHFVRVTLCNVFALGTYAWAQEARSCENLLNFKAPNVEITPRKLSRYTLWGPGRTAPLPAYCRVEGMINRPTGVDGEEFGITFALAMPETGTAIF
jgi:hypothetical protein